MPAGMVMLSEDGVLVPGEDIHLIASIERVATTLLDSDHGLLFSWLG